jgi:hypothetical protein
MTTARRFALFAAALLPMAVTAQEATPEPVRAAATLDRAEVRLALDDARRNGGMKVFRAGYVGEAATNRSRAAVMDEVRQARASGELAVLNAEAVAFEQPRAAGEAARYMALVRGR